MWKTTIVIWSKDNPQNSEISSLAREAETGMSICTARRDARVENPAEDPTWTDDAADFFGGITTA